MYEFMVVPDVSHTAARRRLRFTGAKTQAIGEQKLRSQDQLRTALEEIKQKRMMWEAINIFSF